MWLTEHAVPKDKNPFSSCGSPFLLYRCHCVLLPQEWCEVMWFGPDPSVCVLLTDLSHIAISMATGAVAVATASSQSVLQLDVWAVVAWVTIWGSRQASLTFTKVTHPFLPLSVLCFFLSFSKPSPSPPHPHHHLLHTDILWSSSGAWNIQGYSSRLISLQNSKLPPPIFFFSFFSLLPPILPLFQPSSYRPS